MNAPLPSQAEALAAMTPAALRVLTLNTHKGFTSFNRRFVLHELREAIRSVDADLVFLQEVLGDDSSARPRGVAWPAVPQYEFLADTLWPHFSYGRNAVYPQGHHGNALLSRFPIVAFDNIDVSVAGPERRGVLHCQLQIPGRAQAVHAICLHLGLIGQHRLRQLERVCALVESLAADAPVIVAGDFNDWGQRACTVLQRVGLREVFPATGTRLARTFPAAFPLLRLDRVYTRHLAPRAPRVLSRRPWSRLSDHAALFVEIGL